MCLYYIIQKLYLSKIGLKLFGEILISSCNYIRTVYHTIFNLYALYLEKIMKKKKSVFFVTIEVTEVKV